MSGNFFQASPDTISCIAWPTPKSACFRTAPKPRCTTKMLSLLVAVRSTRSPRDEPPAPSVPAGHPHAPTGRSHLLPLALLGGYGVQDARLQHLQAAQGQLQLPAAPNPPQQLLHSAVGELCRQGLLSTKNTSGQSRLPSPSLLGCLNERNHSSSAGICPDLPGARRVPTSTGRPQSTPQLG